MPVILRALACFVLAAGLIAPALADDRADCRGTGAPEAVIAACTRVIGTGAVQGNQLADLYAARARAYRSQADLDRAIADFDEAIRIDPFSSCEATRGSRSMIIPKPSPITSGRCSSTQN